MAEGTGYDAMSEREACPWCGGAIVDWDLHPYCCEQRERSEEFGLSLAEREKRRQKRWEAYGRRNYGIWWQRSHRHPGWESLPEPGLIWLESEERVIRNPDFVEERSVSANPPEAVTSLIFDLAAKVDTGEIAAFKLTVRR
jgi:hypothetical protein